MIRHIDRVRFFANCHPKITVVGVSLLILWTLCGWLQVEGENETYIYTFVKARPTPFHTRFFDPFESEPGGEEWQYRQRMDIKGNWLPGTKEFDQAKLYCWHRFAIEDIDEIANLENCKKASRLGKK